MAVWETRKADPSAQLEFELRNKKLLGTHIFILSNQFIHARGTLNTRQKNSPGYDASPLVETMHIHKHTPKDNSGDLEENAHNHRKNMYIFTQTVTRQCYRLLHCTSHSALCVILYNQRMNHHHGSGPWTAHQ